MPDIASLTSTASATATSPAQAATTGVHQSEKELLKADSLVVQAAKEHRRGPELCLIMQEWLDREASAQAARRVWIWLPQFGSLLDFPGASGLDTPFFLFLQNLHFLKAQFNQRLSSSKPFHALKNPLLLALYGNNGPLRPFRTLHVPNYNKRRREQILSLLHDQLEPNFLDMSLGALLSNPLFSGPLRRFLVIMHGDWLFSHGAVGLRTAFHNLISIFSAASESEAALVKSLDATSPRLSPHEVLPSVLSKDVPAAQSAQGTTPSPVAEVDEQGAGLLRDSAVLAGAAHLWLNSGSGDHRNALFFDGKVFVLTEFLPLFPAGKVATSPNNQHTRRAEPEGAMISNPARLSSLHPDVFALPLAESGCVSYVHLVGESLNLHSSDLFWSLLACLNKNPSSPSPSLEQIKQLSDGEEFLSALAAERLSFEPPAPPAPTTTTEAKEKPPACSSELISMAGKPSMTDEGREREGIPQEETMETEKQKNLQEQADSLFSLPPSSHLAICFSNSSTPHHLLTPLDLDLPSLPLSDPPLVLTIDNKMLGNTYKATVFSATTGNGVKLVVKYSQEDSLIGEEKVLRALNHLEPELTPKCYGIFDGKGAMNSYRALLLEHGGETVTTSFSKLEEEQRQAIFDCLLTIHKAGYTHGSFAKRNVVRDASGRYRLIDFERAEPHQCPGEEECEELRDAREYLDLYEEKEEYE